MKKSITDTLEATFTALRDKHLMNASIMIENPMAIHDHTDLLSAIESEIGAAAEYNDKLEMLKLI